MSMSWPTLFLASIGIGLLVGPLLFLAGPLMVPAGLLVTIMGFWIFDCMVQLRWMHQRELAMALGVAMRRQAPILPVLEGNPLAETVPWWKALLGWFFPYPFYAPIYAWRHGARAVLVRAIDRARAGDPEAIMEPGLLHADDLLDIQMDTLVSGLNPGRTRGGRLRAELANASTQAIYPVLIMFLTLTIAMFWLLFIAPKMKRIISDLGMEYPWLTAKVEAVVSNAAPAMVAAILVVGALAMLCWFVPRLAWSIPGFSGLIAPWGRGRLLESLGLLVRSGRDLPSALELLDKPAIHGCEARRRLKLMRLKIDEGATANSAMRQAGWIDAPQEAWLGLATRSGRFSEALVELGGSLQSLSLRRLKWRSTLASTFGVLLVGLLVGLVVVAFFIPLVEMIEWLGG